MSIPETVYMHCFCMTIACNTMHCLYLYAFTFVHYLIFIYEQKQLPGLKR